MLKYTISFNILFLIFLCLSCKTTKQVSPTTQEETSNVKTLDLSKEAIKELNAVAGVDMEELIEILHLDVVQTEEFLGAFSNFDEQRKNAAIMHQGDREGLRKAIQSLKSNQNIKMKEILTKDQFAIYQSKTKATSQNKKTVIR